MGDLSDLVYDNLPDESYDEEEYEQPVRKKKRTPEDFVYSMDEALDIINEGRTQYIKEVKGHTSSYGRSHSYGAGNYRYGNGHSFGSFSGTEKEGLNPFWVTRGKLKRHIINGDVEAKDIDGEYYLKPSGVRKIRSLYKRKEAEYEKKKQEEQNKMLIIGLFVVVIVGLLFYFFVSTHKPHIEDLEELGVTCNPRNSICIDAKRLLPIEAGRYRRFPGQ